MSTKQLLFFAQMDAVTRSGTMRRLKILLLAAALLTATGVARGQDTQYWTQQYGTRAELLGGAVAGSFLDLSATYYNPGAIVMTENPDVLLSANAFENFSITLKLGTTFPENPSTTSFGTAPTLFAGLFPKKWVPGRLAYSALTRQNFNVRILAKYLGEGDVLPAPGAERYSTEFVFDQRMSENWFGLTWSKLLREHVGFGVTMYGVYRGQRTRVESISAASADTGEGASLVYVDEFDYSYYRLLWKFGLALERRPVTLGFALTTPSVGLFGSGSVQYTRSAAGVDIDGDGTPDDILASALEEGLSTRYRSPLAVAAGGSYKWRKASVHMSAEWFDGVDKYDVVDTSADPGVFPGSTIARRVSQELASVLNVGAGVEYKFSENWTAYGAFTSDQSAAVRGTETRHSASTWDIYHVTTGAALRIAGLDLTLGVRYSFGSQNLGDSYESVPSIGGDLLAGSKIVYRAWKGIVGFAFGF
jgi:hypothetical protein